MKLTNPTQITLQGEFHERILRSIHHLLELNTDEMRKEFTSPNDFWHWGADYLGRWISAMALLEQYTRESYDVKSVVQELLSFQKTDGSFGPYTDPHDFQEWFGMSRGLVGLLEYYQVSHDDQALDAAARLGDYYFLYYPDCAPCLYECYSTALEGLVLLFKLTDENKYLQTAQRIAESSAVYKGIRYSHQLTPEGRRTPISGQVHCQLTTARGLLDLYEITQDDSYLKPVLNLHDYMAKELIWVSGGLGFYYYRPEENETCTDADWLRLNLQLWGLTEDHRFMDLAEHILVNQLFFNQADNGGFCYLRGLQNRPGAVFDACCSHHGPRAFYDVLQYLNTTNQSTIWINLFVSGESRLTLESGPFGFTSDVLEDPGKYTVSIQIKETTNVPVLLKVRVPEWAGTASLELNGQELRVVNDEGYAQLERKWEVGDLLTIRFPLEVRIVYGQTLGQYILAPDDAAIFYGPRLYALNDFENPTVRLHLVKLNLPHQVQDGFRLTDHYRLVSTGVAPGGVEEPLVFTPLNLVGGIPSGAGRIHTVRSPYYKVWVPLHTPKQQAL